MLPRNGVNLVPFDTAQQARRYTPSGWQWQLKRSSVSVLFFAYGFQKRITKGKEADTCI